MDTPVGSFEALKPGWSALRGAAATPVNRSVSSGAEYTHLETRCQQYIVVLIVLGAIQCIEPQIGRILLLITFRTSRYWTAVARNCRCRDCGCRALQRCRRFLRAFVWSSRSSRCVARNPMTKPVRAWAR